MKGEKQTQSFICNNYWLIFGPKLFKLLQLFKKFIVSYWTFFRAYSEDSGIKLSTSAVTGTSPFSTVISWRLPINDPKCFDILSWRRTFTEPLTSKRSSWFWSTSASNLTFLYGPLLILIILNKVLFDIFSDLYHHVQHFCQTFRPVQFCRVLHQCLGIPMML